MLTENSYIQSHLLFGSYPLFWFPLLGNCEQKNQMYNVKRLSPRDSEQNANEEKIVRLFFALTAGDEHPKTTALSDMLNS